jgi:hypothetical protein
MSRDKVQVAAIVYESMNAFYLRVVTNTYYDKNEFVLGDNVILRDVKFVNSSYNPFEDDPETTKLANFRAPTVSWQDAEELAKLESFINRQEGHEIVETGVANQSGFYNSFYIQAPGSFDENSGKFTIDRDQIDGLVRHNDAGDDGKTIGYIMNASLQATVSFKVVMEGFDIAPSLGGVTAIVSGEAAIDALGRQ